MKISIRKLSFGYGGGKLLFDNFNAELDCGEKGRPLAILGPSGSGKTTLLKLLGGLLKPLSGEIRFMCDEQTAEPKTAFMFQESRLLPWLTVLENVSLPLEKEFGKTEARRRARHFLSLVFLDDKEYAYPKELSGGQAQRVSMARAFAWPAHALLMDEPFQSLDIPLRISLMDLCLSLLKKENFSGGGSLKTNRFLAAVTHEPREAVYMGGRIIILGKPGEGIVFDRIAGPRDGAGDYGAAGADLENEMIEVLGNRE